MSNAYHKTLYKHSGSRNFNSNELVVSTPDGLDYDYVIHGTCRDALLGLKLNSDATANYRLYNMQGSLSSPSASVNDATTITQAFGSITSGKPSAFRLIITGDTSTEKYINSFVSLNSSINVQAIYWKDNVNDLSNITIFDSISRTATSDIWIEQIPKASNLDNYDLMETVELSSRDLNSSPILFSGLDGDRDSEYMLDISMDDFYFIRLGSGGVIDDTASYTQQYIGNSNGSIIANNTTNTFIGNQNNQGIVRIFANSGSKRMILSSNAKNTFPSNFKTADWYLNTIDNINDIKIFNTISNSATGYVKLYRSKSNRTIDHVSFRTVVDYDINGVDFVNGIDISGIEGDRIDGPIKVEFVGSSVSTNSLRMILNNIQTSSYSYQWLQSISSSISAGSITTTLLTLTDLVNTTCLSNQLIYLKSGQNRPVLQNRIYNENSNRFDSTWLNNSTNEITSIKIFADNNNAVTGKIRISFPEGTKQASPSWTVTVN